MPKFILHQKEKYVFCRILTGIGKKALFQRPVS